MIQTLFSRKAVLEASALGVLTLLAPTASVYSDNYKNEAKSGGYSETALGSSPTCVARASFWRSCFEEKTMIQTKTFIVPEARWSDKSLNDAVLLKEEQENDSKKASFQTEVAFSVPSNLNVKIEKGDYIEYEKTDDEVSDFTAHVKIGVVWGVDRKMICLTNGEFSLEQKKPLVTFSNAFFALSQRGATIQELFNGQQRRVETKWDSVEYDPEQWIYGGAVGGLASNILTGEDYNYLVECIVK